MYYDTVNDVFQGIVLGTVNDTRSMITFQGMVLVKNVKLWRQPGWQYWVQLWMYRDDAFQGIVKDTINEGLQGNGNGYG